MEIPEWGNVEPEIDQTSEGDLMLDIEEGINPPPSSPGIRLLLQLEESGQPITLSINCKAELPV